MGVGATVREMTADETLDFLGLEEAREALEVSRYMQAALKEKHHIWTDDMCVKHYHAVLWLCRIIVVAARRQKEAANALEAKGCDEARQGGDRQERPAVGARGG